MVSCVISPGSLSTTTYFMHRISKTWTPIGKKKKHLFGGGWNVLLWGFPAKNSGSQHVLLCPADCRRYWQLWSDFPLTSDSRQCKASTSSALHSKKKVRSGSSHFVGFTSWWRLSCLEHRDKLSWEDLTLGWCWIWLKLTWLEILRFAQTKTEMDGFSTGLWNSHLLTGPTFRA